MVRSRKFAYLNWIPSFVIIKRYPIQTEVTQPGVKKIPSKSVLCTKLEHNRGKKYWKGGKKSVALQGTRSAESIVIGVKDRDRARTE